MIELEPHQLDMRYASLRCCNPRKERRVLGSLSEIGQQMPVVVVCEDRSDRYILIDGYKRVRSLKRLSLDTVQATIWELSQANALILVQLLRRSDSDSPLEQGWLLLELSSRFGLSQGELARRFAVSESWVSRRLSLVTRLPDCVHKEVSSGRIGAYAAQKYLAPLARANRCDAEALCKAIAPLRLRSRQVGTLYVGYVTADGRGRELIISQPELYLRTQAELVASERNVAADPLQQLLRDADLFMVVAKRIGDLLQTDVGRRLLHIAPKELGPCLRALCAAMDALRFTVDQEPLHA